MAEGGRTTAGPVASGCLRAVGVLLIALGTVAAGLYIWFGVQYEHRGPISGFHFSHRGIGSLVVAVALEVLLAAVAWLAVRGLVRSPSRGAAGGVASPGAAVPPTPLDTASRPAHVCPECGAPRLSGPACRRCGSPLGGGPAGREPGR